MYRYVLKRVRDTIEFSANVRKSFACQQNQNNLNTKPNENQQNNSRSVIRQQEVQFLPAECRNYEEFKKRYNCKHPNNCNNFLQAITWSTALIAGFYASQLICLYRRNHRLDPNRCFYSKYLCFKNQQLHKKFLHLHSYKYHQHQKRPFVGCGSNSNVATQQKSSQTAAGAADGGNQEVPKKSDDDHADKTIQNQIFNFTGVGIFEKRFQTFINDDDVTKGNRKTYYNVNNNNKNDDDDKRDNVVINKKMKEKKNEKLEKSDEEKYDELFLNVTSMIGELEFQMGVECIRHGNFEQAANHFKMSTNSNNASACFNLALLYEHGIGVEKDFRMAKRLYQMAADLNHEKALYNLGVFFAQGVGGTKKSYRQAKMCFEKAAALGDSSAIEALSMLQPSSTTIKRKMSSEPEDYIDHDSRESSSIFLESVNYPRHLQSIATG